MSNLPKLVYVDDEEDIRAIAEFALEDDFDLNIFSSAANFLNEADKLFPDVILLDVMMPETDGPTLYEEIKKTDHLKSTPTVFMTAKVQPHEISELIQLGAKGVIAKPFDPLSLSAQIKNFME